MCGQRARGGVPVQPVAHAHPTLAVTRMVWAPRGPCPPCRSRPPYTGSDWINALAVTRRNTLAVTRMNALAVTRMNALAVDSDGAFVGREHAVACLSNLSLKHPPSKAALIEAGGQSHLSLPPS